MPTPRGRVLFKKKEGTITLTSDYRTAIWTPDNSNTPTISLPVANIINLQQTPDSSPKVMLKIFERAVNGAKPLTYLFHFHTTEARAEAQAIKDALSRILAEVRANDSSIPKPTAGTTSAASSSTPGSNGGGSASAAMSFASAVNAQPSSARFYNDNQLKNDIGLQQSLMKKDNKIHEMYMDAIETKPESISTAAFNSQFWSTRTNLLRAHAIEINQKKGAYNVLSTIKPHTVDGELKLNISVEQVQMIFAQHPLVKRIYNKNVPRLSEAEFWSRFFLSKLSKKLRGERVTENERPDLLFDKYDIQENTQAAQSKIMAQSVPHFINLEANEENQGGFRSGNAKDVEMRPRSNIPIVKVLNSLSEKIMANVAPSDRISSGTNGGHDVHDQLALRDLQADVNEQRIMLNIKQQSIFFAKKNLTPTANAHLFAQQDPAEALQKVRNSLQSLDTERVDESDFLIAVTVEDESDSDDEKANGVCPNPRAALKAAEKEVLDGVSQQRSQECGNVDDMTSPMGLPIHIAEKCALTHATSIEFLHQFWNAFLSGDPDRAMELQYLAESLGRSVARIEAVAEDAHAEREAIIRKRKQEIREYFERTGKKIRWKPDMVGGGRDAVIRMMQPALDVLQLARGEYARALAAEGVKLPTDGWDKFPNY